MRVEGEFEVPGDKSITHRALMLAGAASGDSRLSGLLTGADCRSTAAVLRALGVHVPGLVPGEEVTISSAGFSSWREPGGTLDCGNSGTTARLIMGLLAGRPFCATLTGDDSLRSRPMRRVTEPLSKMGASFEELEKPDRLPIRVCGGELASIHHRSPKASAQIKSAVLLAGLTGAAAVTLDEPIQSRDHTERMLRSMGVEVGGGETAEGRWRVHLHPPEGPLPPLDLQVPGDPSSAAFLLALGLLADRGSITVAGVGVNPTRTGFLDAVEKMGGRIDREHERDSGGEPIADVVARASDLRAIEIGAAEVPAMIDEIPLLAVLAARAQGTTVVRGAEELRAKESDRIAAVVSNLRAIGAEAEELPDGLTVVGSDRPLRGRVRTFHDHRIAMAFGVLGALPDVELEIEAPEVVDVSFPGFWEILDEAAGEGAP